LGDEVDQHGGLVQADEMDWDAYAEHYDEMCALNPAYQQNVGMLLERLHAWNLPEDCTVCDLGAGTGNYILRITEAIPSARFWHVDFDSRMIELARKKYAEAGVQNVKVIQSNVHTIDFPESSFDVIVCVNALYAFRSQKDVLLKIHSWLKPTGRLFLIDFGRQQKTLDWTLYIFRESVKSRRIGRYAKALVEGRELLKQNRRTTKGQQSGRYWLHTTEEFGEMLRSVGFKVEEISRCYRDYADFAICAK
jgi:ubiquinone/menaquinone biosynthesis C-methylase UbiE